MANKRKLTDDELLDWLRNDYPQLSQKEVDEFILDLTQDDYDRLHQLIQSEIQDMSTNKGDDHG